MGAPHLVNDARRIATAGMLLILGCALLGAALAAEAAIRYTRPLAPKGTPHP